MLRHAAECGHSPPGPSLAIACSWKLDSSTTSTSKPSGSRTASSTGVPMLPTGATRKPASRSMCAVSWVVVVLPFVPVTRIHSAARTLSRTRQASSMSPQIGMPRSTAARSHGWSGRRPGEASTSSASTIASGTTSRPASAIGTPSTPRIVRRSSSTRSATAVTDAPSSTSVSTAAKPVTPTPSTATRSPRQSARQDVRSSSRLIAGARSIRSRRRRRRRRRRAR